MMAVLWWTTLHMIILHEQSMAHAAAKLLKIHRRLLHRRLLPLSTARACCCLMQDGRRMVIGEKLGCWWNLTLPFWLWNVEILLQFLSVGRFCVFEYRLWLGLGQVDSRHDFSALRLLATVWMMWGDERLHCPLPAKSLLDLLARVPAHAVQHIALIVNHQASGLGVDLVRRSTFKRHCLPIKLSFPTLRAIN